MKLSMFSGSHFRSVEKATTMSKRIQERKKEDELAVKKPRTVCLGQSSSFDLDASNVSGDPQLVSGSVQRSCWKLLAK